MLSELWFFAKKFISKFFYLYLLAEALPFIFLVVAAVTSYNSIYISSRPVTNPTLPAILFYVDRELAFVVFAFRAVKQHFGTGAIAVSKDILYDCCFSSC